MAVNNFLFESGGSADLTAQGVSNMVLASINSKALTSITTFSPTVTLVGGTGNTVPQYSTNTGRYSKINGRAFVEIQLSGRTGNDGAGTGVFNVALPVAASASCVFRWFPCGLLTNAATSSYIVLGFITPGASTITVYVKTAIDTLPLSVKGADQNLDRELSMTFSYET